MREFLPESDTSFVRSGTTEIEWLCTMFFRS